MPAYSVTGRGLGVSHGKPKPENNCGCGGCGKNNEDSAEPVVVPGCRRKVTVGTNTVAQNTSTSGKIENTCS